MLAVVDGEFPYDLVIVIGIIPSHVRIGKFHLLGDVAAVIVIAANDVPVTKSAGAYERAIDGGGGIRIHA